MLNLFKFFGGKEEEDLSYPSDMAIIDLTEAAKQSGVIDNHNKEIKLYLDGKLFRTFPYSEEVVASIKETYNVPIAEIEYKEDEDYEFPVITEFGVTKMRK